MLMFGRVQQMIKVLFQTRSCPQQHKKTKQKPILNKDNHKLAEQALMPHWVCSRRWLSNSTMSRFLQSECMLTKHFPQHTKTHKKTNSVKFQWQMDLRCQKHSSVPNPPPPTHTCILQLQEGSASSNMIPSFTRQVNFSSTNWWVFSIHQHV